MCRMWLELGGGESARELALACASPRALTVYMLISARAGAVRPTRRSTRSRYSTATYTCTSLRRTTAIGNDSSRAVSRRMSCPSALSSTTSVSRTSARCSSAPLSSSSTSHSATQWSDCGEYPFASSCRALLNVSTAIWTLVKAGGRLGMEAFLPSPFCTVPTRITRSTFRTGPSPAFVARGWEDSHFDVKAMLGNSPRCAPARAALFCH